MTSTACDDQLLPDKTLEDQCREARNRNRNVCVWTQHICHWTTQCGKTWGGCNPMYPIDDFPFCPHCSQKIEVKK